jgi:thiol-disulfide isomerase/thioredoxin
MVTLRPTTTVLALSLLLCLGAAHAAPGIKRGSRAAELDARTLSGAPATRLAAYAGRMLLIEFFGTGCPHCQALTGRMNAIHDRYRSRGLSVLGATPDSAERARQFHRRFKVRHGMVTVPLDVLREYGVTTYPVCVLVSPAGRVLWRGKLERLTDRVIDAYLARVKLLPTDPDPESMVGTLLRQGRFGDADELLELDRTCEGLTATRCDFVHAALTWIRWYIETSFSAAAADEQGGDWYAAWLTYEQLAGTFAGQAPGQRAARLRDALLQDPARVREIEAWRALRRARDEGRWQPKARAIALLRPVAQGHPGTGAAAEVHRLLRLLGSH